MGEQADIGIAILVRDKASPMKASQRFDLLHQAISALLNQQLRLNFEVHCWHYGPGDYSLTKLRRMPVHIHRLQQDGFEFGHARDQVFRRTQGDILVTLSADVVPADEHWLDHMTAPILARQANVVQGRFDTPPGWSDFFWEVDGWFWFTSEWQQFCAENGNVALSCGSLAISRPAWEATGFSGSPFCEDKLIQLRLAQKGYKMTQSDCALSPITRMLMTSGIYGCGVVTKAMAGGMWVLGTPQLSALEMQHHPEYGDDGKRG